MYRHFHYASLISEKVNRAQMLYLPATEKGRAPVAEHNLRRVATEPDRARQGEAWVEYVQAGN